MNVECSVLNCGKIGFSRGLCRSCYMRAYRTNQTGVLPLSENRRGPSVRKVREDAEIKVRLNAELTRAKQAYGCASTTSARVRFRKVILDLERACV